MKSRLLVQDPGRGQARFLDAIADAARGAVACEALFAFASVDGVDMFFGIPEVVQLLREGTIHLVVGVSAVTNRSTLELLGRLSGAHRRLSVRVFWDRAGERLFHPKMCWFRYADGRQTTIVGSGNLTPGGLTDNYEAFSITRPDGGEMVDLDELRAFLETNGDNLYPIDDEEVLTRAERNVIRSGTGRRRRLEEADVVDLPPGAGEEQPEVESEEEFLLVAEAPKSRGGWRQLQINQAVLRLFFRLPAERGEELVLYQRFADGRRGPAEHRHLVFSEESNKNLKFDVAAGGVYPGERRPILIFRRRRPREFEYYPLTPGTEGYEQVAAHLEVADDSIGRGVKRVLRTAEEIIEIFPECPMPLAG